MIFDLTQKINPKILVLGPRGSGKTTLLASMYNESIHGRMENQLHISDRTDYSRWNDYDIPILSDKTFEPMQYISKLNNKDNSFIMRHQSNQNVHEYRLLLQDMNYSGHIEMILTRMASDYKEAYICQNYFTREMKDCDIVIVTIDTPFLMYSDPLLSKSLNYIDNISNILQNLRDIVTAKEKEVIFVPVKCEKWVQSGETDIVIQRVKDQFINLRNILPDTEISFSIIPVETIGGIVFDELKDAYRLYDEETKYYEPCSKLNEQYVRFWNGKIQKLHEEDILTESSKIGLNREKYLLEWFRLSSHKEGYSPCNCHLIMVEILRFLLRRQNKIDKASKFPRNIPWPIRHETYLGSLKKELLSRILESYSTEGIHKF